jgi:hypothetical protein
LPDRATVCWGSCERGGKSASPRSTSTPSLRLDLKADRARLEQTVACLSPRPLIVDPFVRLDRNDKNVSGDVAPLLALLR